MTLIAVACKGTATPTDSGPGVAVGGGMGPGISVGEAMATDLEGPLLVNGWLWRAEGGDSRLCTRLTDAVPPQCVEPSLVVRGLDASQVKGLRAAQGVTWSEEPVQLLGTVSNGTLTVSGRSKG